MDTFFIRHTWKLNIDESTRSSLWNDGFIAIHYPDFSDGFRDVDIQSLNPEDHDHRGRNILRRFLALGHEGGYICAEYENLDGCLVGKVFPGSSVVLREGRWRDPASRPAILKALKVENHRIVETHAAAPILVARPRQGTFMRWHRAGRSIERLVEGYSKAWDLGDLSDGQQEAMCGEFLRLYEAEQLGLPRLVSLGTPTGKTMKDLDILGLAADGRSIFGQVTFGSGAEVEAKADRLRKFGGNGHRILFANRETSEQDGVHIVSLGDVFQRFCRTEVGSSWLRWLSK